MNHKKQYTLSLALLVMFLWGSLFPTVKLGYQAFHVSTTGDILYFAGVRFTICGTVICLYSFLRNRQSFRPVKTAILPILLSGLFAIILHYGFTYTGLLLTDSSKTAILKQVGALFYVCFSALFFREDRLTFQKLLGVLLGFGGILIINTSSRGMQFKSGDVLIIAASFCTVFSNVISKKTFRKVDPITATGCSQLFGGLVLFAAGKILGGQMVLTTADGLPILTYICLASIFGYCIWFQIVKDGSLSKLFIIKFAEPVFASICGAVLLGENILQIQYILAFAMITGGISISQLRLFSKRRNEVSSN